MPINHVRRFVLIGVLLAAAIILSACDSNSTPSPRTPKAVFIIVDGIPADVIERVETPNLDAISLAGAYTRAYVGGTPGTASETPTISAPGYMCLITGTWANKNNVWDNDVSDPDYQYWQYFKLSSMPILSYAR